MFSKSNSFVLYYLSQFFPNELCFHIYNLKKKSEIDDAKQFYMENYQVDILKVDTWHYHKGWSNEDRFIYVNKNHTKFHKSNNLYLKKLLHNTNYQYDTLYKGDYGILLNDRPSYSILILNEIKSRQKLLRIINNK